MHSKELLIHSRKVQKTLFCYWRNCKINSCYIFLHKILLKFFLPSLRIFWELSCQVAILFAALVKCLKLNGKSVEGAWWHNFKRKSSCSTLIKGKDWNIIKNVKTKIWCRTHSMPNKNMHSWWSCICYMLQCHRTWQPWVYCNHFFDQNNFYHLQKKIILLTKFTHRARRVFEVTMLLSSTISSYYIILHSIIKITILYSLSSIQESRREQERRGTTKRNHKVYLAALWVMFSVQKYNQ